MKTEALQWMGSITRGIDSKESGGDLLIVRLFSRTRAARASPLAPGQPVGVSQSVLQHPCARYARTWCNCRRGAKSRNCGRLEILRRFQEKARNGHCAGCGSQALLSLSKLLGGSVSTGMPCLTLAESNCVTSAALKFRFRSVAYYRLGGAK
jgi:hypothetical protein